MRLFIATGLYPPESGGPATYSRLLEERLPAHGFDVTVLPFRTVRHLPPVIRHVAYFFKVLTLGRKADLVYAQDTMSVGWPAFLASLLLRKKFVVRVPGDHIWEQGRQRFGITGELDEMRRFSWRWNPYLTFLRVLQYFVTRFANAVVVPSRYMQDIVCSWGVPKDKVHIIYSSIEMPVPAAITRPEGFLVVSSGRRVPWKGFEAIAEVVKREPSWHFFLAEDLPREEALGWVKAADVYVLNSTYEGLSHALVEAMMLGTPVIATAVGGNPELITDKVDGLLVPPKDNEALYRAIKEVAGDPQDARVRAEAARQKTELFSAEVMLTKLDALLRSL